MKGWFSVRKSETIADAKQGTMTPVWPDKLARMRVVDSGVRVTAVSNPAGQLNGP